MIFLGANDAVLPNSTGQDVPLPQYRANLKSIIQHPTVRAHCTATATTTSSIPSTKIILVTPPPVDEYQLEVQPHLNIRTAERTKSYADACQAVGKDLGVAVLDLWGIMMEKAGWEGKHGEVLVGSKKRKKSKMLGEMLCDGEWSFEVVHYVMA